MANTIIAKRVIADILNETIEEIEPLPIDFKLTDRAQIVRFDYRCKINGKYKIVEMQREYKTDVVKRFFTYLCTANVVQLESLPTRLVGKDKKRVIRDYHGILPVMTIVWMVDDMLKIEEELLTFQMLPSRLADFVKNEELWENGRFEELNQKRKTLLKILNNDTKNLTFLRENELVFLLHKNILKSTKETKLKTLVEFIRKSENPKNTKEDFEVYKNDDVFAEIIRVLKTNNMKQIEFDAVAAYEDIISRLENLDEEYAASIPYKVAELAKERSAEIEELAIKIIEEKALVKAKAEVKAEVKEEVKAEIEAKAKIEQEKTIFKAIRKGMEHQLISSIFDISIETINEIYGKYSKM